MKELEEIDLSKLKKAGKLMNDSGLTKQKVRMIGSKQTILDDFTKAVESVPDEKQSKIPKDVVLMFNDIYGDEGAEPEEKPAEKKDKKPAKKEEKKPEKKAEKKADKKAEKKPEKAEKKKEPKKSDVELDALGNRKGSQAAAINAVLLSKKGGKLSEIAEKVGTTPSRIRNHIQYLKSKKYKVTNEEGVYQVEL